MSSVRSNSPSLILINCEAPIAQRELKRPMPETSAQQLTIGDAHANVIKIIETIFASTHLFKISDQDRRAMAEHYATLANPYSKAKKISNANEQLRWIIQNKITVNPLALTLLRLIGDETADRGASDLPILDLINLLDKHKVFFEILFSNHGLEFIKIYEEILNQQQKLDQATNKNKKEIRQELDKLKFMVEYDYWKQYQSLSAIQKAIDRGNITRDEVLKLIPAYKKGLRAVSYSISEDKNGQETFTLFTHAINGLQNLFALAKTLKIPGYNYASLFDVHGNVPDWLRIDNGQKETLEAKDLDKIDETLDNKIALLEYHLQLLKTPDRAQHNHIVKEWKDFLGLNRTQKVVHSNLVSLKTQLEEVKNNGLHQLLRTHNTATKLKELADRVNKEFSQKYVETNRVHTLVGEEVTKFSDEINSEKDNEDYPFAALSWNRKVWGQNLIRPKKFFNMRLEFCHGHEKKDLPYIHNLDTAQNSVGKPGCPVGRIPILISDGSPGPRNILETTEAVEEEKHVTPSPTTPIVFGTTSDHVDEQVEKHACIRELENAINSANINVPDPQCKINFINSLNQLKTQLAADITAQIAMNKSQDNIQRSDAVKIAVKTTFMLLELAKPQNNDRTEQHVENKLQIIQKYEQECQLTSLSKFTRGVITVIFAAVGFVLGALLGAAIGIIPGIMTGPGAFITGFIGAFKGSITGAAIGATIGGPVAATAVGSFTAWKFFKPNKFTNDTNDVIANARSMYQPK